MGLSAGDVFLDVRPNLQSFNRELQGRLAGLRGPIEGALKPFGVSMGQALTVGLTAAAVVGFKATITAAADLGEAINASRETLGASSEEIEEFAETAAESFGLSKTAAIEGSIGFAAMFQASGLANDAAAEMSTTMAGLAGDMASFRNQDPEEMLLRLRSGLAGEAEPLRKFGVFLSEAAVQLKAVELGLAETGDELTDAQKVQARYAIILEQTTKAQGDFARTLGESLPNQMRAFRAELTNMAAEIGTAALPLMTDLTKVLRELVPVLRLAFENILPIGAAFATLLTIRALPTILFNVGRALQFVGATRAGSALGNVAGGIQAIPGIAGFATVAVGLLAVGLQRMSADAAQNRAVMEGWTAALVDGSLSVGQLETQVAALTAQTENMGRAGAILRDEINEAAEGAKSAAVAYGLVVPPLDAVGESMAGALSPFETFGDLLATDTQRVANFADLTNTELKDLKATTADSIGSMLGSIDGIREKWDLTSRSAIRDMESMARMAKEMARDFKSLDREAVPEEFKAFLLEQGPAAVHAFVTGTEREKARFVRAWKGYEQATRTAVGNMEAVAGAGGRSIGVSLVEGLRGTIAQYAGQVSQEAAFMVRDAIAAARAAAGAKSPSKEMEKLGRDLIAGLIQGMDRDFGKLRTAADELVTIIESAVEEGLPRAHLELAKGLADLISDRQRVFDKLIDQAQTHFDNLQQRVEEFEDAIRGGFADTGDLISELMRAQADALREGTSFGEAEIGAILAKQMAESQQFAAGLTQLQAAGLGPAALADLAGQGPEALPLITALLAGGEDLIASFNTTAQTIAELAGDTAAALSETEFGKAIESAGDKLVRLEDRIEEVIGRLRERVGDLVEGIRAEAVSERIEGLLDGLRRLENALGSGGGGGAPGGAGGSGGGLPVPPWEWPGGGGGPGGPMVVINAGMVGLSADDVVELLDEALARKLDRNGRLALQGRGG